MDGWVGDTYVHMYIYVVGVVGEDVGYIQDREREREGEVG